MRHHVDDTRAWWRRRDAMIGGTLILAVSAALLVGLLASTEPDRSEGAVTAVESMWVRRGVITMGPLTVTGATIDMGDVPLEVTHVPTWTVVNPTSRVIPLRVGQPQVALGCCPGPVVVDGALINPGSLVPIPAGGEVELAFPLRMHGGMDGPHHLLIPLEAEGASATLEVIADFTDAAQK